VNATFGSKIDYSRERRAKASSSLLPKGKRYIILVSHIKIIKHIQKN